jgi:hypothetical protein
LGEVAAGAGKPRRAGQLLGKARRLLAEIDPLLTVIVPYDLPAALASARTVDPSAFDQGLADGETWSLDQAVSVAMAEEANSRSTLAP